VEAASNYSEVDHMDYKIVHEAELDDGPFGEVFISAYNYQVVPLYY
tara:strand:- start:194 stop:331 length:138 start_codon:yes stop_codon:yes gene_type:complete